MLVAFCLKACAGRARDVLEGCGPHGAATGWTWGGCTCPVAAIRCEHGLGPAPTFAPDPAPGLSFRNIRVIKR